MSKIELPRYISPDEIDYKTYFQFVKGYNRALKNGMEKLLGMSENDAKYCFLSTGSDGRYEKDPQSPMDTLTLVRKGDMKGHGASRRIRNILGKKDDGREFFMEPEVKVLGKNSMSYYNDNKEAVYPTRILDARYITGDRELLESANIELYEELNGRSPVIPNQGTRILKRVSDKRKDFRRVTKTGRESYKGKEYVHFIRDAGIVYSDNENGIYSVKYGPLRLVQFRFAEDFLKFIKITGEFSRFDDMPRNTEDRIHYLQADSITDLTPLDASDLIDNYQYFTWLYHKSQHDYKNGTPVVYVDKNEFSERIDSVLKLTEKPIVKKPGKVRFFINNEF